MVERTPTPPRARSLPVERRAQPVDHAPEQAGPTATRKGAPVGSTLVPGPMPCSSPSGISSVRPSRKPTTSAETGGRSRPRGRGRPRRPRPAGRSASMISPIRLLTRPWRRARSASSIAPPMRASRSRAHAALLAAELGARSPRGRARAASRRSASTSLSRVRTTAPPRPTRRSACTLAVLDAAGAAVGARRSRADELQVARVDERSSPGAGRRCGAARRATTSSTRSGWTSSAPERIFAASASASSTASRSSALCELVGGRLQLLERRRRASAAAARAWRGPARALRAGPRAWPSARARSRMRSASRSRFGEQPRGRCPGGGGGSEGSNCSSGIAARTVGH